MAREMGIWAKLNHVNVLPFLGFILKNDYPSLVSEWIDNGTVLEYLKNNPLCDVINLVCLIRTILYKASIIKALPGPWNSERTGIST